MRQKRTPSPSRIFRGLGEWAIPVAMARPQKLKVFRTPIGFHDAYVAAPSQKAAIEAWGSDRDLFSRGEAELVTDPVLTAEPLASPGVVVKRLRGTAAEQIAALGRGKPASPTAKTRGAAEPRSGKSAPKPKPRPKRTALEAVEQALEAAKARQAGELKAIAQREAALAREKLTLQKAQAAEAARLTRKRDAAKAAYDEAMRRWRES